MRSKFERMEKKNKEELSMRTPKCIELYVLTFISAIYNHMPTPTRNLYHLSHHGWFNAHFKIKPKNEKQKQKKKPYKSANQSHCSLSHTLLTPVIKRTFFFLASVNVRVYDDMHHKIEQTVGTTTHVCVCDIH